MEVVDKELKRAIRSRDSFSEFAYRLKGRYSHLSYMLPALVLLIGVVFYPVIYSIKISFYRTLAGMPSVFVGLENFKSVLQDPLFSHALVNTLIYMSISVTLSFVIGFAVAILVQSISRGRDFFRMVLIIPLSMAPMVVALMWRWMFHPLFGLINWAFGLVGLPLQSWINETATAMAVVIFVDIWQWYPLVFLILTGGRTRTMPVAAAAYITRTGIRWGDLFAAQMLIALPVIIFVLMLRRHLVRGFSFGMINK